MIITQTLKLNVIALVMTCSQHVLIRNGFAITGSNQHRQDKAVYWTVTKRYLTITFYLYSSSECDAKKDITNLD